MNNLKQTRIVVNGCLTAVTVIVLVAVGGAVSSAHAQTNKSTPAAAEKSASEQYSNMSDSERAALIYRANAKSAVPSRAATPEERALLLESPADARARLNAKPESVNKNAGTGKDAAAVREMRTGDAVGKVVGTALSHNRMRTISADGKHVDTCETGAHTHDKATEKLLSSVSSAPTSKGTPRE
jgi:hypothetical protein